MLLLGTYISSLPSKKADPSDTIDLNGSFLTSFETGFVFQGEKHTAFIESIRDELDETGKDNLSVLKKFVFMHAPHAAKAVEGVLHEATPETDKEKRVALTHYTVCAVLVSRVKAKPSKTRLEMTDLYSNTGLWGMPKAPSNPSAFAFFEDEVDEQSYQFLNLSNVTRVAAREKKHIARFGELFESTITVCKMEFPIYTNARVGERDFFYSLLEAGGLLGPKPHGIDCLHRSLEQLPSFQEAVAKAANKAVESDGDDSDEAEDLPVGASELATSSSFNSMVGPWDSNNANLITTANDIAHRFTNQINVDAGVAAFKKLYTRQRQRGSCPSDRAIAIVMQMTNCLVSPVGSYIRCLKKVVSGPDFEASYTNHMNAIRRFICPAVWKDTVSSELEKASYNSRKQKLMNIEKLLYNSITKEVLAGVLSTFPCIKTTIRTETAIKDSIDAKFIMSCYFLINKIALAPTKYECTLMESGEDNDRSIFVSLKKLA